MENDSKEPIKYGQLDPQQRLDVARSPELRTAIPDYSDASAFANFRFWLIKLIAGRSVVVLNASFDIIKEKPGYGLQLYSVSGGLFANTTFPIRHGYMIEVAQK